MITRRISVHRATRIVLLISCPTNSIARGLATNQFFQTQFDGKEKFFISIAMSTFGGERPICAQCLLWLAYQMNLDQYINLELIDTGVYSGYSQPPFHQLQK